MLSWTQEMFEDPIGGSYLYYILVKKKGDFRRSNVFPPNSWLFWCLCGDWSTACSSAEAPVVEGDFSNIMPISYPTPTISLVDSTSNNPRPRSPTWSLGNPPAAEWDPQGGNKVDQTLTEVISFEQGNWWRCSSPSLSKGPGIMWSNGNSACNLYFYFAQIAQCMVYLATCPKTTKM